MQATSRSLVQQIVVETRVPMTIGEMEVPVKPALIHAKLVLAQLIPRVIAVMILTRRLRSLQDHVYEMQHTMIRMQELG